MNGSDKEIAKAQRTALTFLDTEDSPIPAAVHSAYEELKRDQCFLNSFRLFNSLSPRRANVFSLMFSILPWEPKRFSDSEETMKIVRDFSKAIKTRADQIDLSKYPDLRGSFENRTHSSSDHPFQFGGNIPGMGNGFHLWFLVGDHYPLSIDGMIVETKTILKAWKDVTEIYGLMGLASVSFGDLLIAEQWAKTAGRMRIGPAFTDTARLVWDILLENQKDLAATKQSLVVCNQHACALIFEAFVGRRYETSKDKQALRFALQGDCDI